MKDAVKRPTAFDRFADWVSEAMGRPVNIAFWFVLIIAWTLVFALGGPKLSSGTWLPSWFTSQGFNFPLNLITTVAELFIGFLVATASNRAQNALTALLDKIDTQEQEIGTTEASIVRLIQENTEIISHIRTHHPGGQRRRPHCRRTQMCHRAYAPRRYGCQSTNDSNPSHPSQ
jgi:low affinity Fe/Cu permease